MTDEDDVVVRGALGTDGEPMGKIDANGTGDLGGAVVTNGVLED